MSTKDHVIITCSMKLYFITNLLNKTTDILSDSWKVIIQFNIKKNQIYDALFCSTIYQCTSIICYIHNSHVYYTIYDCYFGFFCSLTFLLSFMFPSLSFKINIQIIFASMIKDSNSLLKSDFIHTHYTQ